VHGGPNLDMCNVPARATPLAVRVGTNYSNGRGERASADTIRVKIRAMASVFERRAQGGNF
jgi:hypothetical protein